MEIKIGDKIAYIKYDVSNWSSHQDIGWGYAFYVGEDSVGCAKNKCSPVYISNNSTTEKYFLLDSDTKSKMTEIINKKIENLNTEIKSLTSAGKDDLVKTRFNEIKQQIIKTAKNMINSDENDFLTRLKSICEQKKQLFSITISDLDNIHKKNGAVKCKIKKTKELLLKINEIQFE
jgi:hypothetical protein